MKNARERAIRNNDSRGCPDQREHKRFRDKLTDDARAACSHREAQCDLARPSGAARQQQIGHIGGGNQEHQAHGCKQDQQGSAGIAYDGFKLGPDGDGRIGVGFRIFCFQGACNGRHFGAGLLLSNTGPQAGNYTQMMIIALHCRRTLFLLLKVAGECEPEINGFGTDRELEPLRHHPDNGNSHAIQVDRFSKNITAGIEMRAPEMIAQDSDIRSGLIFLVGETAS